MIKDKEPLMDLTPLAVSNDSRPRFRATARIVALVIGVAVVAAIVGSFAAAWSLCGWERS